MSAAEFRDIFQREIERHLKQLNAKDDATGDRNGELSNLPELRRLANIMSENVLQRMTNHAAFWGIEAELAGPNKDTLLDDSSKDAHDPERAQLEARLRDLEAQLEERQHEADGRKKDVLEKFKAEYDVSLQRREEELADVRRAANFDPLQESFSPEGGRSEHSSLRHEFADQIRRIHNQLAETKDMVGQLSCKKTDLDKIDGQQRAGTNAMEVLLASANEERNGLSDDEEDLALEEAIRKGEQVAKRMRRHVGGA
eukprot:TRINITY_DN4374_c3_g1_i2.p1 TRINITY_DN4374_c3_g1~~TRINITY_DN4374_c3_g1_i2.p1  ORF type:complete len:256 (+),score=71.12 TRINITY_DN4374_c3_g1_i2:118-885(+)